MRNVSDLHQAIEKSAGKDIHLKLVNLDNTKSILNRNYFWLLKLDKYLSGNIQLMEVRNRDTLNDFQIEFARHLHNYLASVKSLVDHTRVVKKKLNLDQKFEQRYDNKRISVFKTDTASFIQQLREYVQHYELLPTGIHLSIDKNDDEKLTLILATDSLSGFSGWKASSKRVLDANPKDIDIFKLLEKYQLSVEEFYKWFYAEMEEMFKNELTEFDELRREYKTHYDKMMGK